MSEPTAAGTIPGRHCHPAEPLLDPRAHDGQTGRPGSQGVPIAWLLPQPPMANSTMCVMPMMTAPASIRRWIAGAVTEDRGGA